MNDHYESGIISLESRDFLNTFCLPHSSLIYNSFSHAFKSFSYSCPLNKTLVQINERFILYTEERFSNFLSLLKSKIEKVGDLRGNNGAVRTFHYVEIRGRNPNLREKTEISSFLFNARNYKENKEIELRVWNEQLEYVLYGSFFIYFKDQTRLNFINLEKKNSGNFLDFKSFKGFKPLNFCEKRGNFAGNCFLIVSYEKVKKLGVFELFLDEETPRILQEIEIPSTVLNSMKIDFFSLNFSLIIFSHDYLFPNERNSGKKLLLLFLQKFENVTIFRLLIFEQVSRNFICFFSLESQYPLRSLEFRINYINENLFFVFEEKFMIYFRNLMALKGLNGSESDTEIKDMNLIKKILNFPLLKSLASYRFYDELAWETREIVSKILKKPIISDSRMHSIVNFLLKRNARRVLYILMYSWFIEEKREPQLPTKISRIDSVFGKIWSFMDFYDLNKNDAQECASSKGIFALMCGDYHEILKEFNDYDYVWIFFSLRNKNFDLIKDILIFKKQFSEGKYLKIVQKLLILVRSEEKEWFSRQERNSYSL